MEIKVTAKNRDYRLSRAERCVREEDEIKTKTRARADEAPDMAFTISLSRGHGSRVGPKVLLDVEYPAGTKVSAAVDDFFHRIAEARIVWELDMALHIDDPLNT
jgi:hypothetical protein